MAGPASSPRDGILGRLRPWRPGRLALRLLGIPFARLARVQRVEFFVQDFSRASVPADEFAVPPRVPIEFRLAVPEDAERFAADFAAAGVDPAEARRRLVAGDIAYLGIVGDVLAHHSWETTHAPYVDEVGMRLLLGPGECSSYGAYTAPAWRGQGIQPASIRFRAASRRARGVRRAYSWVRGSNASNLRVHDKLGSDHVATVWTARVAGMSRPRLLRISPRGALRFAPP